MALEGTVKTPLGHMSKKTAAIVGVGAAGVVAVAYYRQKKTQAQAQSVADAGSSEIDPATGYPYGSAEDAAALAAQNAYVSPTDVGGGGGASSIPASNVGYSSNGQWQQAAVQILTSNGEVSDPTALSAALGAYLTGAYATDTQRSLIQQAIAVAGYPPVAGPSGYPPSINTQPTQTGLTPGTVSGLHATRISTNEIALAWSPASNANGYDLAWTDAQGRKGSATSLSPAYVMPNLPKNERYTVQVRGKPQSGSSTPGAWSSALSVTTKAK